MLFGVMNEHTVVANDGCSVRIVEVRAESDLFSSRWSVCYIILGTAVGQEDGLCMLELLKKQHHS